MGAGKLQKIIALALAASIIAVSSLSCSPAKSFDSELERAVSPYAFDLVGWEFGIFYDDFKGTFSPQPASNDTDVATVQKYFSLCDRVMELESEISRAGANTALETELGNLKVERLALGKPAGQALAKQITETLSELGIYNPADIYLNIGVTFPPVYFKLADPPYLLVVSSREKIETLRTEMLATDLTREAREKLETEVDNLGVISLTVKLGGVATYPSFVSNRSDLRFAVETSVHEWAHQYLTFRPLGFRYMLSLEGIVHDSEIAALDETVASMVGKEIGKIIYERYYATPGGNAPQENGGNGFDFNAEMRDIREKVDIMLTGGNVNEAEAFMEERRQYITTQGYYLRKLNQAYFAFYGTYADSPSSIDPLGNQMRELRNNSRSIKDFLDRASFITSRADLEENLKQLAGKPG